MRPKGCADDIEKAAKDIRSRPRKAYGVSVAVSYGEERIMTGIMKYL
ncbi:MAG: hypothetical protein ACLR56_02990 [Oscillospiraceae bacterium]